MEVSEKQDWQLSKFRRPKLGSGGGRSERPRFRVGIGDRIRRNVIGHRRETEKVGVWYVGTSHKVAQSDQHRMSTNGAGDGYGKAAARKFPVGLELGPHRLHAPVKLKGL